MALPILNESAIIDHKIISIIGASNFTINLRKRASARRMNLKEEDYLN